AETQTIPALCAGGDHAMTSNSTKLPVLGSDAEIAVGLLDEWFDPIEAGLRDRVRDFIQTMIESELEAVLSRPRYARRAVRSAKACPREGGGYGEPGVAKGESRLGCLECPLARRGTDRPPDPRRHGGAGQARPQGHLDRAA